MTIKGNVAWFSTSFLRFLNYGVLVGAIFTAIAVIVVGHWPVNAAWGLLAVSAVSAIAAFFGACFATLKGAKCALCHYFWLLLSAAGLVTATFVVYTDVDRVLRNMTVHTTVETAKNWLKVTAAVYAIMFCVQVVIFVLGGLVWCCDFNDYYEDIEMAKRDGDVSGMKEAAAGAARRTEESNNAKLSAKMKEKYGKWAQGDEAGAGAS